MTFFQSFAHRPDIVYVDGDDEAVRAVGASLARCGEVRQCATLEEARAELRECCPSLLVIDPDAPGGDGLSLIAELRAREPWLQIFVLCEPRHAASTALFIAAGANDLAVKPFDVGTLPKRVARLLRAASSARGDHQERLELENKVRHADRIASLGILAATVTHEIAGPLQVINLNASMLAEAAAGEPLAPALVAELGQEILMAGGAIDGMLDRVRAYSRPVAERRVEAELGYVLDAALLLLKPRILERRARVARPRDQGPQAPHYPTRLAQALMNVIANAIETRPDGANVEVRFVVRPGAACIEVLDDGPGLPEEVRRGAAAPFFSTKADGTGLGLHLIRRVMSEHGGSFETGPRPDGQPGACATLVLPLDPISLERPSNDTR
jgi:signal transduction histidine kinase